MKHKFKLILIFVLTFLIFRVQAQTIGRSLESIDIYISEPATISNSVNKQGADIIRKSLKGEYFTIPKDWRLVSVVPDKTGPSKGQEYVLFFQDAKGDVHSLGMNMSGALSGTNMIHIQAK
jgi:hypothetical protein